MSSFSIGLQFRQLSWGPFISLVLLIVI